VAVIGHRDKRSIQGHSGERAFLPGVRENIRRDALCGHAAADRPSGHAGIRAELEIIRKKLFQSFLGSYHENHLRDVAADLKAEPGRSDVVKYRIPPFSRHLVPRDQYAAAACAAEHKGTPQELGNDEERSRLLAQLFELILQLAVGGKRLEGD